MPHRDPPETYEEARKRWTKMGAEVDEQLKTMTEDEISMLLWNCTAGTKIPLTTLHTSFFNIVYTANL